MAANPVLVDSCYYIRRIKEGQDPLKLLALTAASRDLAICGVVRCEVARGLWQPGVRAKLSAFWDVMLNVPADNRLWADVEETAWQLDRKGVVLPLTDVIIGCSARRIKAAVLTHDKHFHDIPGITVLDQLPL
jgi:predicted nucleic acid-binding protein